MTRLHPILVTSLWLLGSIAAFAVETTPSTSRPNVLLICVDDLKPVLGCYGDKTVKSPNIDRLAARSVLFERAYCNQAVCSPSRNSLLVGLRPQTLGIYDLGTNFRRSRPDAVTLPQLFKQHGWRTEALGKIFHVGHGNTEDSASWSVPHWKANVVAYALPASKAKEGLTREEALFANKPAKDLPRGAAYEAADVPDNTYPDGALADEAIRRLRNVAESLRDSAGSCGATPPQKTQQKPTEPFFLAVGFVKPHLPFVAPQKYWDLYDRAAFKLAQVRTPPTGAPDYAPQFGGELRQYSGIPESGPLNDELQRTLIHGYHAATSYMDAQLGRVVAELDRLGLAQNTIIVLWGDHGWHLGDHGIWCKHTNYEQATRIPLLVAVPGAKAGARTSALAETVDIYPTLCELAGVPAPAGLDGRSFAATLRDPAAPTKDHTIHVYPRTGPNKTPLIGRAIRTARHRLVEWKKIGAPAESAELELYDYETDPLETKNVAADQPAAVAELRVLLAQHPEAKPQLTAAPASTPAKDKPKQDRNALFDSKDKNKDGKLTREEFLANQPDPDEAPKRFPRFDSNNDGVLSREEFVTSGGKNKE
ncbi:MAG: sulfatase-like hydrolase/transferase [Planctomycetales bacterium]|nr:sulfatase-like hydrolase/transferase [Planctomycetales bacterium]